MGGREHAYVGNSRYFGQPFNREGVQILLLSDLCEDVRESNGILCESEMCVECRGSVVTCLVKDKSLVLR